MEVVMGNNKNTGLETIRKNISVYRPRTFVEAVYELSKSENDIIDIILSQVGVEEDVDSNLEYQITVKDYVGYFGLDHEKNVYRKIKNAVSTIHTKTFSIYGDKYKISYSWVQTALYLDNEGLVLVKLGEDFKKMLVDIKRNGGAAIFYSMKYSLPLKSQYSKRIYYMCLEWAKTSNVRMDNLEDLRKKLKVPESYNNGMFKKKVLDVAVSEINEITDLIINYSLIMESCRGGQCIKRIDWSIRKKTEEELAALRKITEVLS